MSINMHICFLVRECFDGLCLIKSPITCVMLFTFFFHILRPFFYTLAILQVLRCLLGPKSFDNLSELLVYNKSSTLVKGFIYIECVKQCISFEK